MRSSCTPPGCEPQSDIRGVRLAKSIFRLLPENSEVSQEKPPRTRFYVIPTTVRVYRYGDAHWSRTFLSHKFSLTASAKIWDKWLRLRYSRNLIGPVMILTIVETMCSVLYVRFLAVDPFDILSLDEFRTSLRIANDLPAPWSPIHCGRVQGVKDRLRAILGNCADYSQLLSFKNRSPSRRWDSLKLRVVGTREVPRVNQER